MTTAVSERVAIVTGGCGGLGAGIAERLVSDGLRVAVADLALAVEGVAESENWLPVAVDVTNPDSTRAMAATVLQRWGRIDALVNGAGIAGLTATIEDYPPEEFRRVIDVNLLGVFYCTQACVPELRRRPTSRIVNLASIAGRDPNASMSAYSASKAAVIAFTRSLAKELLEDGVLANTVVPGVFEAGLTTKATEAEKEAFVSRVPLGRMGRVEELAEMVAWVASPRCSFTTGATFDISGGRSTL